MRHSSLRFRALLYMLAVGGGWLVALPALLLLVERGRLQIELRSPPVVALGVAVFAAGVSLALAAGWYLVVHGRGTPFPLDPTHALVTAGPYAWVRNPQAIAMTLMVIGEILAVQSELMWLLLPATLIYLEVLVGPWEERQMLNRYGESFARYRRRVRKWLPIPPRFQPGPE